MTSANASAFVSPILIHNLGCFSQSPLLKKARLQCGPFLATVSDLAGISNYAVWYCWAGSFKFEVRKVGDIQMEVKCPNGRSDTPTYLLHMN